MYSDLIKRLREDAFEQERVLHVCNSTMNAAEAAEALEQLQSELARVTAERDAAVEDIEKHLRHEDMYDCSMCIFESDCRRNSVECERDAKWRGAGKERTE